MKYFVNDNVVYLENTEFSSGGQLVSDKVNKTGQVYFSGLTIVMIQGVFCGYCTQVKGIFQSLADEMTPQGIDFATIQIDGERPGEAIFKDPSLLSSVLGKPMQGVPLFVKFYNGLPVDIYEGPREYASLKQWISQ